MSPKSCSFFFLGSGGRGVGGSTSRSHVISLYPLSIRHQAKQGDVNFSWYIQQSNIEALDKIFVGGFKLWLTPVKHPQKRGATNWQISQAFLTSLSSWSPGQNDVMALRGCRPTVTSIAKIASANDIGHGIWSVCQVYSRLQRKRDVAERRLPKQWNTGQWLVKTERTVQARKMLVYVEKLMNEKDTWKILVCRAKMGKKGVGKLGQEKPPPNEGVHVAVWETDRQTVFFLLLCQI